VGTDHCADTFIPGGIAGAIENIGVVQTRVTLFPVSALPVGAAKGRVSKSLILADLL